MTPARPSAVLALIVLAAALPSAVGCASPAVSLEGFYSFLADTRHDDPSRVFTVQGGAIRISGDGLGYLATRETFRDYRLVVEYRWGERNWGPRAGKARDSGIFLHAQGPDGNSFDGGGAFMAAIECNVMEGAVGDLMLIRGKDASGAWIPLSFTSRVGAGRDPEGWPAFDPEGEEWKREEWGRLNRRGKDAAWADRFGFRGAKDPESPVGAWTRVECICAGDRIKVLVNGRVVNEAYAVRPSEGKILLQCERSEIFIRRFELLPLP